MLKSLDTSEANRIFTIKKLFTDGYYNYRFSSLFISTIDNMIKMTVPYITKFEYNDMDKYIEIMWDSSKVSITEAYEDPLRAKILNVLSGFLRFCYEDKVMRDILYSINPSDFKVFDNYMKSIYEYESMNKDSYISAFVITDLVNSIFKIVVFSDDILRVNLI